MTECKFEKCWCKNIPQKYSEMYEAMKPLHDMLYDWDIEDKRARLEKLESMFKIQMEKYTKTLNQTHERMLKCERVLFSKNPHKCPVCLGKRIVENREVDECVSCHATGIVWG